MISNIYTITERLLIILHPLKSSLITSSTLIIGLPTWFILGKRFQLSFLEEVSILKQNIFCTDQINNKYSQIILQAVDVMLYYLKILDTHYITEFQQYFHFSRHCFFKNISQYIWRFFLATIRKGKGLLLKKGWGGVQACSPETKGANKEPMFCPGNWHEKTKWNFITEGAKLKRATRHLFLRTTQNIDFAFRLNFLSIMNYTKKRRNSMFNSSLVLIMNYLITLWFFGQGKSSICIVKCLSIPFE